jgi:hypothetical protein
MSNMKTNNKFERYQSPIVKMSQDGITATKHGQQTVITSNNMPIGGSAQNNANNTSTSNANANHNLASQTMPT